MIDTEVAAAMHRLPEPVRRRTTYEVVLRRANGRFVRALPAGSRYAARQLMKRWETAYDEAYYVDIRDASTHDVIATSKGVSRDRRNV